MNQTRLVELTLHHNIQDCFARTKREQPPSLDRRTYALKYKNILPNFPVTVKKNGIVQLSNSYITNYLEGLITFNTSLLSTDIVEIEYSYCTVNLYDEGTSTTGSDFKMPAVAVYDGEGKARPFELGNSKKEREAYWNIEVMCERGGERNDITDVILEYFEADSIAIIDYNMGFPLMSDGTKNIQFNPTTQTKGYMSVESINYAKGGSLEVGDSKRFISQISVELTINI